MLNYKDMNKNNITVIIPTYNREKTILRAVNSVLKQTIGIPQIIIIDDASTDHSDELLQNLQDRYKEITYLVQKTNLGACAARNRGIREAKTEFIAFLDSDDEWYPDKLEKQINFYKRTKADIVTCSVMRIEKNRHYLYPSKQYKGNLRTQLLRGNFISTGMIFGKKECFKEGFDESLPRLQDWDMMIRIAKEYKLYHQHIPLAAYYIQSDSISMNHKKLEKASKIIFNKYKDEFKEDNEAMSNICQQIAISEIMTDGVNAKKWLLRAQKSHQSVKGTILLLICRMHLQKLLKKYEENRLKKRCGN